MGFMREVHFFIPTILALCLGGCASGANTGFCSLLPDTNLLMPPVESTHFETLPKSHHRIARKLPSKQLSAIVVVPAEAPEPRAFSKEWWARENARVNKALVICRDCATAPVANVTELEKTRLTAQPAVTVKSELP
jgi:hypothetical protein